MVFVGKNPAQADLRVFVENQRSRADLNVCRVKFPSGAGGNKGLWFFSPNPSRSDKKIHFVSYPSRADLKIFFVDYPSQAGWNKREKQYLLE